MAPRLQVDSGLRPERLRPVASPVDTFVPTAEGGDLAQLAGALTAVAPSLSRFAGLMQERDAKQQSEKGAQAARKAEEQRLTYREAVKQGVIKPSDNPWFRVGAEQQFGRAAAGQYARALQAAIATDEGMQSSADPADFVEFEATFRKTWLEENVGGDNRNTNFEKGFGIVDGYTMDEGRRFTAAAGARMEKQAGERVGIIIGQVLDQHYKEGPDVAANLINAEIGAYLTDNPKGGRAANLRAVQAIEDWARVNYSTVNRSDVEGLLRKVNAGPGSTLFGTHEAKEMMSRVEREIISMRGASMNLAEATERREEKAEADTFWQDMTGIFVQAMEQGNLGSIDLTQYVSKLAAIDPSSDAPLALFRLRDGFLNAKAPGNDEAYRNALMWAEGVSPERRGQYLTMNQLANYASAEGMNGAQLGSVMNAIQERSRRASEGSGGGGSAGTLLRDPFYGMGEQYLRGKIVDAYGSNPAGTRAAAENAVRDFTVSFLSKRGEIAGISDPAKQSEYITRLADQAFSIHAPDATQKANQRAGNEAAGRSGYAAAAAKVQAADIPQLNQAMAEFNRGQKSAATARLLTRLGVPLNDAAIRSFFQEWERNN